MLSLGWPVVCDRHLGWRGSIRATGGYFLQANPSRTARMPAFEVRPPPPPASSSSEQEKRHRRNYLCLPDGIDSIVYWASHETEVASLCPSWRTEVARSMFIFCYLFDGNVFSPAFYKKRLIICLLVEATT